MKESCGDEACKEVIIPSGDLAAEAQGVLAGSLSDEVLGEVFDSGEIGRSVIGADAAFIVAEDHVHDPMQAVLDCPMTADDGSEKDRQQDERGDVEACLPLDRIASLPGAFDDDDSFQAGPVVALL